MNHAFLAQLNRVQKIAMVLAVAGVLAGGLGVFFDAHVFLVGYLFGYLFWLCLSLGCFVVAMVYYLTGGRWGEVTRRFLEAGYMTLPVMAVLFIPIILGVKLLYPWSQAATVAANPILQKQAPYMNFGGFTVRAVVYFLIWIFIALRLRRWSLQQDQTTDVTPTRKIRSLSGPGVVIYALTTTFAFIDWVMSLEPDWHSTMSPLIICVGQILSAYAFIILMLAWARRSEPFTGRDLKTPFHHLGNLLLAFVMFWTYVSFGQFLIVWAGNLPDEIGWYRHRINGGWMRIIIFLAVFNFMLPFFILLFRASKRPGRALAWTAGTVLASQVAHMLWLVVPAFYPAGICVSGWDFAALVGVGGIWVVTFIAFLKRAPLLARNDPRMEFAMVDGHEPKFSK